MFDTGRQLRRQRNTMLFTGLGEIVFGSFWVVGGRYIPEVGPYWGPVGYGLMLLGVVFVLVAFRMSSRMARVRRVVATGLTGKAYVRYVDPTGTVIGGVPIVHLGLDVHIEGRPTYRADGVTYRGMVSPGSWLSVAVAPDDPEDIVLS